MEGYQLEVGREGILAGGGLEGRERIGEKVQGLRSIIGRYKIDREMSRIV